MMLVMTPRLLSGVAQQHPKTTPQRLYSRDPGNAADPFSRNMSPVQAAYNH